MTKQTIEFYFDPEQLAIVRRIEDGSGNLVQERLVSPNEAIELDETLIEELIAYGETNHPSLFGNIRNMNSEEIVELCRKINRMIEALRTLVSYKRNKIETIGDITVVVDSDGMELEGATVSVLQGDTEVTSGTTDPAGQVIFSDMPVGEYTLAVSAPDHDSYRDSVILTYEGVTIAVSLTTTEEVS